MAKLDFDVMIDFLNSNGYELIDWYKTKGWVTRLVIRDSVGYKYDTEYHALKRNNFPTIANVSNPFSLENISLWLKVNNKSFELFGENVYLSTYGYLNFYCRNCDDVFPMKWSMLYASNCNCPFESGQRVTKINSLGYLRPDLVKYWSENNSISAYDITSRSGKSFLWQCPVCRVEWERSPHEMTKNVCNYPCECTKYLNSWGEKKVFEILEKNNIKNINQFRFKDCRNVISLPFDFYLSGRNTVIEYQGEQHYEAIDFSGEGMDVAEMNFLKLQKRDKIKKEYCENNGIKLIIIPYWEFDNIEEILKENLSIY